MNTFSKYFLSIFLPWAIAFFAVFTYFYLSEVDKINTLRLESERLNVRMGERAINQDFQAVMSDLLILSKHNAFHHKGSLMSLEGFKSLQADFLLFSKMKTVYDQIRFLDTEGLEIIRVNYKDGSATAVPANALQNKGGRYYFEESLVVPQGQIYVSPLDLNMERGQIEQPFKPMIRFGTPVFNAKGEKTGIVLLNYLADRLLGNFSSAVANIGDHAAIVNLEGYWLKHPQPDKEWGFMLDNGHNFSIVYPATWKEIVAEEGGQFTNDNGIFTFTTIHLFQNLQQYGSGEGANGDSAEEHEYKWKVISHVAQDTITAENRVVMLSFAKIAAPIFLFLILISYLLALAKTKNKKVETLLKHQATIDALTGLPNRQLFHDRLSRAILHNKRLKTCFALFFIDLDRFKIVNDTLGHAAGDLLLQQASERIQAVVRESDTVARLGGDEFTIILNAISKKEDVIKIAEYVIETISLPFLLDDKEANIGASIGIALFPEHGVDQDGLMDNADSAMYKSKEAGRNRYCFFDGEPQESA